MAPTPDKSDFEDRPVMASSSDRWRRIEALFYEALDLKPEEHSKFLAKNCPDDADLRKEIEALLASATKPLLSIA